MYTLQNPAPQVAKFMICPSFYVLYHNMLKLICDYLFEQLSTLGEADLAPGPAKAGSKKKTTAPHSSAAAEKQKRRQISRPIPAGATVANIEDDALEGLTIPKKK